MNIKTWQDRAGVDTGIVGTYGYEGAMQAEIDELRAALLESKDVGLRLLTCRSLFSLARGEINAQRKVLEQAKTALEINRVMGADENGNYTREITPKLITDAITAIQGVLKS